jgi:hypothetical protein
MSFFILMREKHSLGAKRALNAADVQSGAVAVVLVAGEA